MGLTSGGAEARQQFGVENAVHPESLRSKKPCRFVALTAYSVTDLQVNHNP
jgi:hypothetical protein